MLNQQLFQVTIPIIIGFVSTIWVAAWMQNKRLDEMSKRLDDIIARLGRIEAKLDDHEKRISLIEGRLWK